MTSGPRPAVAIDWRVAARPLEDADVERAVAEAWREGAGGVAEISVALVDDATLAELHGRFLDDPSPTDVMSFDLGDSDGVQLGEIVVSVDRARAIARERGVSAARETALYLVHGALHLLGHDDHEDADRERMRDAEAAVLERLGYARDTLPHDLD